MSKSSDEPPLVPGWRARQLGRPMRLSCAARGHRGGVVFSKPVQIINSTTQRGHYEREQDTLGEG
jgi:hypothetical protein